MALTKSGNNIDDIHHEHSVRYVVDFERINPETNEGETFDPSTQTWHGTGNFYKNESIS